MNVNNKVYENKTKQFLRFKHISNKVVMNINLYSFFGSCIIIQNKQSYMRVEPV